MILPWYLWVVVVLVVVAGVVAVVGGLSRRSRQPAPEAPVFTPEDERAACRRLFAKPGWRPADPERNDAGLYRAENEKTGLTFVLIPPGRFRMGSPDEETGRDDDEGPVGEVTIGKPFLLCETECTQAAWDRVGGEDDRRWRGPRLPIERVSWNDVKAWCGKAGLRLPTEAEWEYACRAGTGTRYSFGDDERKLGRYAWYFGSSKGRTHEVRTRKPNGWGLYDMYGNVREWCEDGYHDTYDGAPSDGSAWVTGASSFRVHRGGGWGNYAWYCRSAFRDWNDPLRRDAYLGFRPARD